MKKIIFAIISGLAVMVLSPSCKKEIGNLNNPTIEDFLENATKPELNNLVTGIESGMRNNLAMYLDVVGLIGREMYRFTAADPRYLSDLLGAKTATLDNNTFYLTNPWASRYRVVKNCNILIEAATNSGLLTDDEKKGYTGFAKTIKAYQLLLNLNLTHSNGIRVEVADPDNLGPVLAYKPSLAAIKSLLDEGQTELGGASVAFSLTSGFTGFNDNASLVAFNRAIYARVAAYDEDWAGVLTSLDNSFMDMDADLGLGIYHVFSTASGDILNPAFVRQNEAGEVRVAHPSYATDLQPGDDRIGKATLRNSPVSSSDLTSNRDVWVYTSATAPVPLIRNEELILLYAEAKIRQGAAGFNDAVEAINTIRNAHNLTPYSGPLTSTALIDEVLYNRRYSLFFEGHRWVDMRRYNRLAQLPKDRAEDDVWEMFPLPLTE
ncbi:RagB/SusD family nutrient uptake outer membrane protein [Flavihumibacter stibioxidans]|uniref:Carbohydrate-binding protein SusD n=1 Tax=Flavihumibacter stibioxidans TaxID=1834163 RepID=A0ABR7M723_9BACT|nr:RagB/SusD family nutrient uptake outer membrane protein [Flavihumibacter stibioxidans]MBC6490831.1 carbohydrate-binding protein SusD [Flavihumibacter stibioxidans]